AIQNLRFYVLDGRMRPVPAGVPGELYIGGAGVARGYLGRPSLSAEKFVPDPFAGAGDRMYRTGDRARWLEGGNLMILGRTDNQVKIRGYRVELGEIEAVLRRQEGVSGAIVVVREDAPGEKRLVAYVAGEAETAVLRETLRATLPEYMVPAAFVRMQTLPQTATGKIDPKTLPAPVEDGAAADDGAACVAPRTPVERALAEIWAQALRRDRVGVEDSFFELGGDSILSIQVVSRARRAGLLLSPRHLFEHPTIAALAAVVEARGADEAPAAEQGRVEGSVRLTPIQAWYFDRDQPVPGHYNQSVLLEVDGSVSDAALQAALDGVLAHHDALRLRFRRAEAGWEQWHADEAGIALERVDLSALSSEEQDRAQAERAGRAQAGLDLEHGPLGRAVLLDRGGRGRVLLLVLHHLVVDGVSWRILREDLEQACEQAERGEPVRLGAKTTSYRQWAQALEAYAASDALTAQAEYWQAQGARGVAPLPVDGEGDGTLAAARVVTAALDEDETRALLREVPAAYRTQVNDVLLTALAQAVSAWTGSPRVRLALEGHGREEEVGAGIDLTRTVGWFTSVYPLVLDLSGATGPGERLKAVKEQLRAVPLRGIGHGVLRHLSPDAKLRRRLAGPAEPEILFNYLGQFDQGIAGASRFRFAAGARGAEVDGGARRRHLLDVNGRIAGGCLQVSWTYGEGTHRRETVEALARAYVDALREIVAHCRQADAGGYTPSDFPLAELSQGELDAVLAGRRDVEDLYPLSPLQEGLLFHALYGEGSQAHQAQAAQRLEGPLDVALLRRAWAEVAARHPILRTAFAWEGLRRPLQRVDTAVEVPWTLGDWSGLAEAEQAQALERYMEEDRVRGYALDQAPLMRCALFRAGPDAHWFVWSRHHLLTDGWASTRIINEVFRLYGTWSAGGTPELRRVRPFRDYIAWLRRQDAGAAERYWRALLAGFSAATPLGLDRPARPGHEVLHAVEGVELPAEGTRRLEEVARGAGVTLNTVVQGAWALLLSRYGGEEDVVFGHTVAGRPADLEGVDDMVGVFINTLPVRVRVPAGARLGPWLAGLQREAARARDYEYAPLAQVQEWSEVPRGTPLFESHYIFHNYPAQVSAAGGEGARLRMAGRRAVEWSTYPLSLVVAPGPRLGLSIKYDGSRFDAAVVRRILGHLRRVLEQAAADPDARLGQLDLLTEGERAQVATWSGTAGDYRPRPLHELVAAQAERMPDAAALVRGGRTVTYRALDTAANRLAHRLAALGAGPETLVGVVAERTPDTAVAMLAALKAGAAYLPLDPAYPAERLRYMLADSGAGLVVCHGGLPASLREAGVPAVLDTRAEAEAIAALPETAPAVPSDVDHLAYVIYTSGSTGRPKGVAVTHRGVPGLAAWKRGRLGQRAGDRALQFASFSFDAAVEELFGALLTGSTLVMAERDALLPGEPLRDTLRRERVTFATLPPSALAVMDPADVPDLRVVVSAGEALPPAVAARWAGAVELHNAYGPTETTVSAASGRVAADGEAPPIGRPLEHVRAYVLDAAGLPVPPGVPGELYLGGAGVARGYLRRPALTAGRFVPDPFSGMPGARMYRTGDRARWTDAGDLAYLGRLDEQVKIRGFRIELGEIEAVLRGDRGLADCAVAVREDVPGQKRLVAYFTGAAQADALRARLQERLPEYMVPGALVRLDALPLTPNGKLDRRALPAPEDVAPEGAYVAPRNAVEEALAGIWAEVLGLDRVGVEESFFELGGDSILSIQVVSLARRAGLEVTPRQMFEYETIAELASVVEHAGASGAPAAEPGRVHGAVPLTPIQAWYLGQAQPAPAHYNQSVLLEVDASVPDAALEAALAGVLDHHDALRLRLRRAGAGWEQRYADETGIVLERVDLSALDPGEQDRAQGEAAQARQTSLDLENGPLGRAVLLDRGPRGRVLLIVLHHLAVDGVSWRILREDLERACAQAERGEPVDLGARSTSYRQWADALEAYAAGDALADEAAYWLGQGTAGVAPLPLDGAPVGTVEAARSVSVALDADETRALLQEVPAAYRTQINDVLLAALAQVVGAWTGTPRVRISLEGHGREEEVGTGIDLTRTVGWFTSVYPVVLDVTGAAGPGARLKAVKEQLRGIPLRGIGHGVLRHLSPDDGVRAALAAQAEPEIGFNYLGQFDQGIAGASRFRFAAGRRGAEVAPENRRAHLLAVGGRIAGGTLQLSWTYDEGAHRRETVERLAHAYGEALRGIIAHCRQADAGGYTPSDFPLARLSQAELDAVLAGRRGVEDLYPLSPMQEGMLFHNLYGDAAQAYHAQVALRLEGTLDLDAFRRAWAEVVARHAVLRTAFVWEGLRRPLQRVDAAAPLKWTVQDWSGAPEAEQEAALRRYLDEDRAAGFQPGDPPLMRHAVLRTGPASQWVVW
ncbi:non-ribosomal peptide synthetase, partial [Longimicrobium sp.]|uniref:non-ribosomal peptide synthetase n=1 Tax=Longimicrobium sp. TaxID=2029185 RepID=UPI002E3004E5